MERDFLQRPVVIGRCRIRRNSFKLEKNRFTLDIRKKLFSATMVRHWDRLLREAVDAPIPGSVSGQIGQGSEFLGLLVPAHGRGFGSR